MFWCLLHVYTIKLSSLYLFVCIQMVSLYRDPMGENVFRTSSEAHASAVRGMERTFTQSQSRILDMETSVMKDEVRNTLKSLFGFILYIIYIYMYAYIYIMYI